MRCPPTRRPAPRPFDEVLTELEPVLTTGLTHWQSPRFFGYFPASISPPAVLGDLLSSGLGVQGMLWATSPACTEVETLVLDWLAEMLALPPEFTSNASGGGVIQDSASSSTLVATVAARHWAPPGEGEVVAYTSAEAHSSVEKAARVAGIGSLRKIPVDDQQAMRADLFERAVEEDLAAGRRPALCVATVGTTSTGAVDPVPALGQVCRRNGMWLHVDAAYAGVAALLPEKRWINHGLELADSYCTNPHKWLLTNFDCSAFWVADRTKLTEALSVTPPYLRNAASESGRVIDYRDWQIPLGRRFRALKLWFVINCYGVDGLKLHVRRHIEWAEELGRRIQAHPRLRLVRPVDFGLVCFEHGDGDQATARILEVVNGSGRALLTSTRVEGRLVARVALGGWLTSRRHVEELWESIEGAA
ncbi:MAG: aromatic-L-amino-acid decarboxylase [Acidimicrobiia bacterium]|nr:MAG: aromatic-L-amino-acid decarboxylase [Acidimicrobiia bacterium]